MAHDIRETDWKVLRGLKPVALSRYCDRVLSDVMALASDGGAREAMSVTSPCSN